MKIINKNWVRILISLFGGGMITEIIHIKTGNSNLPNFSILFAVVIYVILTIIVSIWNYRQGLKERKVFNDELDSDLIDE